LHGEKTTHGTVEIFRNNITDKGLIFRLYKELQLNNSERNKWAKDLSRHFCKDMQIASKHMKRWSATLIITK
jgi:hypothetical protein